VSVLPPRVRRALLVGGAVLIFIILAGATYQGVATALERREFPRPGGLVSIGDHQLHIYCTGHGSPAVILEAPAAGLSAAWGDVQSRLAAKTRVCSYDRAGLGWSEASDRPYDPGRVPEELRALLSAAHERGPFVVVGQGLGAALAQLYAARPDSEAVALVLIDPPPSTSDDRGDPVWVMTMSPWLARAGVLRAGRILSSKARAMTGRSGGAVRAFLNRPDHLTRAAAEIVKWEDAARMAAATPVRPEVTTTTVEVNARDRVAFLTAPADVDRAVAAIEAAVTAHAAKKL
jgi:pimeloyl-ACP methyl ester carboxylesterase